jgi:uncharacterized membrane protein YhaH (DUF805 family)
MEYMLMPLKRYFDFSGRSRRKELWMFLLLLIAGSIVASILDTALGLGGSTTSSSEFSDSGVSASFSSQGGILSIIWFLATIIPWIAVLVRRAHDGDKSGWFILVPIYNIILCMFLDGTRGPNRFGPDPKGGDAAAQAFN